MLFCCFPCVLQFYEINCQSQNSAGKSICQMEYLRDTRKFRKIQKTEPEGLQRGARGSQRRRGPPRPRLVGLWGPQAPPPAPLRRTYPSWPNFIRKPLRRSFPPPLHDGNNRERKHLPGREIPSRRGKSSPPSPSSCRASSGSSSTSSSPSSPSSHLISL